LVKDLRGVETLGSITLLATDKTGTLTQNKMTVVGLWINEKIYSVTGVTDEPDEEILQPETDNLKDFLNISSLCTRSKFDPNDLQKPIEERGVFGDATEAGLLRFAAKFLDVNDNIDKHPKIFEIPFSSSTKWHLSINELSHNQGTLTLLIKGAPEKIFSMCKFIQLNDEILAIDETHADKFNKAYETFAMRGQRVLAFAKLNLPENFDKNFSFSKDPRNFPDSDFIFVGLLSLMDPPKKGVRKAIAACRTAGIQVVMVTGDHPLTAEVKIIKILDFLFLGYREKNRVDSR
jgi:sodium/potassium-transporting ATPase subunit alpha